MNKQSDIANLDEKSVFDALISDKGNQKYVQNITAHGAISLLAEHWELVNVLLDRSTVGGKHEYDVPSEPQSSVVDQEDELYIGSVDIFAGYLGRDDLTANALIEIDGEMFYRTGDLVCVVMKWGDDHLVDYVQSSDMNEEQLREHCQSHLPPHMIPSIFMVLQKLPLNANGKIDRKQLPEPTFGSLSVSTNEDQYIEPKNTLEMQIHSVWSEILQRTYTSINTNFFSIGDHSLLLVQLYHRYKTIFEFDTHNINMAEMIEYSTIADHARLIHHWTNSAKENAVSWFLLRFSSNKFL